MPFVLQSCPLSYILHRALRNGLGLECASLLEVKQALRCGCDPRLVVFDRSSSLDLSTPIQPLSNTHARTLTYILPRTPTPPPVTLSHPLPSHLSPFSSPLFSSHPLSPLTSIFTHTIHPVPAKPSTRSVTPSTIESISM